MISWSQRLPYCLLCCNSNIGCGNDHRHDHRRPFLSCPLYALSYYLGLFHHLYGLCLSRLDHKTLISFHRHLCSPNSWGCRHFYFWHYDCLPNLNHHALNCISYCSGLHFCSYVVSHPCPFVDASSCCHNRSGIWVSCDYLALMGSVVTDFGWTSGHQGALLSTLCCCCLCWLGSSCIYLDICVPSNLETAHPCVFRAVNCCLICYSCYEPAFGCCHGFASYTATKNFNCAT